MGKHALSGVRILDMTHVQAGPTSSQLLAWMGADVIKFEPPGTGDITRSQLCHLKDAEGKWVDSLYFTMLNGNKRSITVNMKSKAGCDAFEELIRKSDVMMENFGPGVLDRPTAGRQDSGPAPDRSAIHPSGHGGRGADEGDAHTR